MSRFSPETPERWDLEVAASLKYGLNSRELVERDIWRNYNSRSLPNSTKSDNYVPAIPWGFFFRKIEPEHPQIQEFQQRYTAAAWLKTGELRVSPHVNSRTLCHTPSLTLLPERDCQVYVPWVEDCKIFTGKKFSSPIKKSSKYFWLFMVSQWYSLRVRPTSQNPAPTHIAASHVNDHARMGLGTQDHQEFAENVPHEREQSKQH